MSSSLHSISKVNEITPHLLLTSVYGATRENIHRYNCSLLVNCAQELPKQDINGVESIKLFLDDTPYAIINVYFDRIADKIHEHANRGGRTIIHCVCGISRAASLSCAYLMKYKHMSLREAYQYILARRGCINPNQGFWRQLIDYETRLRRNPSTNIHADNRLINYNPISETRSGETSIPIQIITTSSSPPTNQPQRQTRSSSVRTLNSYTASDYTVPEYEAYKRHNTLNIRNRYNHGGSQATPRSPSVNSLFSHAIPMPSRNEISTYESSTSRAYRYPNGNHRTSLVLDTFNDPRYSSIQPSTFSTTAYKSPFDRYY